MSDKFISILAKISLAFIFLIVIAGSVVRMTGSGMGCPDWPKCFGYLVPPTDEEQVLWHENQEFKEGQKIIHEEKLLVATADFTTAEDFNANNWEVYEKHDYAVFNVYHTWTEYINRLASVLAGIPILLLAFFSLFNMRKRPVVNLLSFLVIFFMGFEAWLGKVVVDGNLIPGHITIHMMGVFVIMGLLITIISKLSVKTVCSFYDKKTRNLILFAFFITLSQIILGTQVRQEIDEITKALGYAARSGWVDQLGANFYVHRSYSILVLLINGLVVYRSKKLKLGLPFTESIVVIMFLEVLAGVLMAYAGMPAALQPVHLLLSVAMYAIQFFWVINFTRKKAVQLS